MTESTLQRIARSKALLASRAELERMQLALSIHELRERIAPARRLRPRGARPGMIAAAVVGVGLPLLGRTRLSRALRGVSIAMSAWRLVRHWRSSGR